MADISIISRLLNGVQRNVDISTNTLVTSSIKVGGTGGTELTQAILNRLISLQNGSDVDATYHTHDGRYFTETELAAATGTSGSELIGDEDTYSNFTPTGATVKGALEGIDTALTGVLSTTEFYDNTFRIKDEGDATKKIAFEASAITTATVRTITMADANVDLADVNLAVKTDGSRDFTADQSMGGFKLTDLAEPTSAQDAATKFYVDSIAQGLEPKGSVRATYGSDVSIAALNDGLTLDGVLLATGDRVLLKSQTDPIENGVYIVTLTGPATRATDFDGSPDNEVEGGDWVYVEEGTTYAGSSWAILGSGPKVVGTDPILFTKINQVLGVQGGDGIDVTADVISVNVDGSTIEISADALRVKDAGISTAKLADDAVTEDKLADNAVSTGKIVDAAVTEAKLAASVAGDGLSGGAGSALSVNVDGSTIEISTDSLRVKDLGISTAKLADASVDEDKLSSSAADQITITGGSGSKLAVAQSPAVKLSFPAGEALASGSTFAVRMAVDGETAGAVYKADYDASTDDLFWVIGMVTTSGAVAEADPVMVTLMGQHYLQTPVLAADIGKPLWLTAAGAYSITAPSASNQASFKLGIIQSENFVIVDRQMMGVN